MAHWRRAVDGLSDLSGMASTSGWRELEPALGASLSSTLADATARLASRARVLSARLESLYSEDDEQALEGELTRFRDLYLRTEIMLDFYGDAINTRTNPRLGAALRACDSLAGRFMSQLMVPLAVAVPPVLTYLDRGLGASILKAGLRLWDGSAESPVAAIKVVRHNLSRPTSILHEAGHQIAHSLDWNGPLAAALGALWSDEPRLGGLFAGWASEIAADALAFVGVGYSALAALHDVLSGDPASVFRLLPGDPHPFVYVRVGLNVELCRHAFGRGPWDELEALFRSRYPLSRASSVIRAIVAQVGPRLPEIAELLLERPFASFRGRSLSALSDPARVSPSALGELERRAGPALYHSSHWLERECVRALAANGLRIATEPGQAAHHYQIQSEFMRALGSLSASR